MNIYEKLLEAIQKNPSVNVFKEESQLGMADIKEALEEKRKKSVGAKAHPQESEYVCAALEGKIKNAIATLFSYEPACACSHAGRRSELENKKYSCGATLFSYEPACACSHAGRRSELENKKYSCGTEKFGADIALETPPVEKDADFAIPCFRLAKERKENPNTVAQEIAKSITEFGINSIARAEATGGYVNIQLDITGLARDVLEQIEECGDAYGASQDGAGNTAIIEYSSPNATKPMSVGNLRSTIIGESLKRIYEFQGYRVIGINHLGDFGTQFGKLLVAYYAWKDDQKFKENSVQEMLRLYVKFHEEAKKDEMLEEKGREMFRKLEQGDQELVKLWLEFCVISVADFQKIYDALGVKIDLTLGESFYETILEEVAQKLLEKKIAVKNEDGSVAVNFPDERLPSFLLKKKDGSSLYALRDIAAAEFRVKEFSPAKVIYVVGSEQTLHFRQVFATLESMGYNKQLFRHDGFGMISLPEGKMSTREGRVIFLEDLLGEAKARAKAIIVQKNPDLKEPEQDTRAEHIGVSSVVYNDLSQSREKKIVFSWDKALSLDGNSAPYLLYGYARAKRILEKAGEEIDLKNKKDIIIETEREKKLIRLLARFPKAVRQACADDAPHHIAVYANTLVQEFNRFYNEDEVLKAQGNIRTTRLALVKATAQVIKNALTLLNIKTLERM